MFPSTNRLKNIDRGRKPANIFASQLSEEQLIKIFDRFDSNRDGHLSKEELKSAYSILGMSFPGLRALKALFVADENRDGYISQKEFIKLMGKNPVIYSNSHIHSPKLRFQDEKQRTNAGKAFQNQNYDFTEHITEAGRLSAPAKSEGESMFLTEEQLKEVFKRFEAIEQRVLDRVDLKKAFNHFGLFFPHHAANVFDAKKKGCVKLTELDDLVNSAVRLGYTVN